MSLSECRGELAKADIAYVPLSDRNSVQIHTAKEVKPHPFYFLLNCLNDDYF